MHLRFETFPLLLNLYNFFYCCHCCLQLPLHHGVLHQGVGEMVEEPWRCAALPVHGQGQCSLPHCCLPLLSNWSTGQLHTAQPHQLHWLVYCTCSVDTYVFLQVNIIVDRDSTTLIKQKNNNNQNRVVLTECREGAFLFIYIYTYIKYI